MLATPLAPAMTRSRSELRGATRHTVGYRVKVITADQMITFTSALNLSRSGILLTPPPELAVGSRCGVAIFLTDHEEGRRVIAYGTVVRSDARGNAIHFTKELDKDSLATLEDLMASLAAHPDTP